MSTLMYKILAGETRVPEGFPAALAQTVNTVGPLGTYSFKLDPDYWFFLEYVFAKWAAPTDAASIPRVSLYRQKGSRDFWAPLDLRLLGTPAIKFAGGIKSRGVKAAVQLGIYFPPGGALQMRITGHVPNDPPLVKLVALGRYVLAPDGAGHG